jgi:GTP-binding protein HflX
LPERVWLSAATGAGVDLLLQAVTELVGQDMVSEELHLAPDQGSLRAALYSLGAVATETYGEDGVSHLCVRLPRADWNRLMKKGPEPLF